MSHGFRTVREKVCDESKKLEYEIFIEKILLKSKELIKQQSIVSVKFLMVIVPKSVIDNEYSFMASCLGKYIGTKYIDQGDYIKMIFDFEETRATLIRSSHDKSTILSTIQKADELLKKSMKNREVLAGYSVNGIPISQPLIANSPHNRSVSLDYNPDIDFYVKNNYPGQLVHQGGRILLSNEKLMIREPYVLVKPPLSRIIIPTNRLKPIPKADNGDIFLKTNDFTIKKAGN